MSTYKYFTLERHGRVLLARIRNPPDHFFAIEMLPELSALLDEIELEAEIVVLVFTGADPDIFVSHLNPADLNMLVEHPDTIAAAASGLAAAQQVLSRLSRVPPMTIAAINGRAWGAGCEFALACDLRFMTDAATGGIAMLESTLGLTPGLGAAARLRQLLGPSRALHLLLSAKGIGSKEALGLGLVHEVLPGDRFVEHVLARAAQLTFHTRDTIQRVRRCTVDVEAGRDEDPSLELEVYIDGLRSATTRDRARRFMLHRENGKGVPHVRVPSWLLQCALWTKPDLLVRGLRQYFRSEKALGAAGTYCLRIDGPRASAWTVTVRDGELSIRPGLSESADVTMIASGRDWADLMTGRAQDIDLFVADRFRVHGDLMRAVEFQSLFVES